MAMADYKLCDVCGGKAFYDSRLNYEVSREQTEVKQAGEGPCYYTLDYVGDWAVLCNDCSKTHKTAIVPISGESK